MCDYSKYELCAQKLYFSIVVLMHVLVFVKSYLLQSKLNGNFAILFRRELIIAHMGPDIRTVDSYDSRYYESEETAAATRLSKVSRTHQTPFDRF